MRTVFARHLTYANVMATVAVFIALGGSAFAARYVITRSSQVKDGAITSADVKNGSLTGADVKNKSLTASDVRGALAGPPGAKGETGPRGVSAWDTIPSGTTVTGAVRWDLESAGAPGDFQLSVPLPARAPQDLGNGSVDFATDANTATIDDDPGCTGTAAKPTAPPGQVCLYLVDRDRADSIAGYAMHALSDSAFRVGWQATGTAGDMIVELTWAYAAP